MQARTTLAGIVIGLSACTGQITESASAPTSVQSASFTMKSWGRLLHQWTLDEAGRVEHIQNPAPFSDESQQLLIRRVTLQPPERQALSAAIDRVEAELARPEGCEMRMTDGPYGDLSWTEIDRVEKLPWNANCTKGRDADLSRAITEADKIVQGVAMRSEPVERRPVEPSTR